MTFSWSVFASRASSLALAAISGVTSSARLLIRPYHSAKAGQSAKMENIKPDRRPGRERTSWSRAGRSVKRHEEVAGKVVWEMVGSGVGEACSVFRDSRSVVGKFSKAKWKGESLGRFFLMAQSRRANSGKGGTPKE